MASNWLTTLWGNLLSTLYSRTTAAERTVLNVYGGSKATFDAANNIKMNRKLAQQLYRNTNQSYALAAQLVKPIINNNVNFIGTPKLFGNKRAVKVIEDTKIDYRKVHKATEIDGSTFVWPQWNDKKQKVVLVQIPVDMVNTIYIDPITKDVKGYKLVEQVEYTDIETDAYKSVTITYVITEKSLVTTMTGSLNAKKHVRNPFGIIPIVHFSNDKNDQEQYGHSEIENIEPQLKFYHELTYEAGAAQKRDGHPKLKVSTNDVRTWVDNNFGGGTYANIKAGNGSISMDDRDLFLNQEGDDVNYLYLNKTSGDYTQLSERAFTNIVEGSETPEINFGANIGTSLASVKEYRPVWIKKIEAKQFERTQPWLDLYNIIIKIYNYVNLSNIKTDEIEITWPRPNFASVKEQSEIVKAFASAIDVLKKSGSISREETYDTLKKLDIFDLYENYIMHKEAVDEEMAKERDASTEASTDESGEEETQNNEDSMEDGVEET